jgi:iron complex outermembrane receptor protein
MVKVFIMRSALVAIAFSVANTVCIADPSAAQTSSTSQAGSGLEEIIVTARRREENVQSVPISITVLSQQTLQQNNVQSLAQLQYLVPSLTATDSYNKDSPIFYIRGQGINGQNGLIPAVEAYLNEVPIPQAFGGGLAGGPGLLFDLENVSVLKGPQGTLQGRNTMGGAILIESARPTNDFGGHIQASYGNYNDEEVDGAINLPILDDKLLARVAFNGQLRDGYTHILGEPSHPNGFDADNQDHWSVRATVTFRPTDAFQNDAILSYTQYTSHASPIILTAFDPTSAASMAYPNLPALFAQQQSLGARTTLSVNGDLSSSGYNAGLQDIARINLTDTLTVRNLFGLDQLQSIDTSDCATSSVQLCEPILTPARYLERDTTEELQLLGKSFGGRFDWILGAFYLDEAPVEYTSFVQVNFGNGPPPATPSSVNENGTRSKALYAHTIYDLSSILPGLKFNAGVRYTWDDIFASAGPIGAPVNTDVHDRAPTWTVGMDYGLAPNTLLYVASRRGYRAGGFNSFQNGVQPPPFGPERVTDVELGIKSDWKVGSMPIRTNVAVYDQDYSDIQVEQSVALGGNPPAISIITENAATARIYGVEVEALANVTDDLQLGATFDYLNFAYTKFDAGVPAGEIASLEATQTAGRPPRKWSVNGRYHFTLAPQIGDLSVQTNYRWQAESGIFLCFTSPCPATTPSFGLLNMSADWRGVFGSPIDISLFGSNLTNKIYPTVVYGLLTTGFGFNGAQFGEPRMYGIRVNYRFGAMGKQ